MRQATRAVMTVCAVILPLHLLAQQPSAEATLRGRIIDADGRPMADVHVVVLAVGTDREFIGQSTISAADGTFAIPRLPAGTVIMRATPRSAVVNPQSARIPLVAHPPAYYPGTLERREAWAIEVKAGEIVELDFHMPPVFIGSIKTVVSNVEGVELEYLRVIRPEANEIKNVKLVDGVGYTDSLRAARYVVAARGRARNALVAAFTTVQMVGGEIVAPLRLQPAARVIGRVVAERGSLPLLDNARVIATWTDGTMPLDPIARDASYIDADRSFTIGGLFGARTFDVDGLPETWQVTAVRHESKTVDKTGLPLEPGSTTEITVVLGQRFPWMREPDPLHKGTSSVRGTVVDAATGKGIEGAEVCLNTAAPIQGATRIVAGKEVTRVLMRANKVMTDASGAFAIEGIADGTYMLAVLHQSYLVSCPPLHGGPSQCLRITLAPGQQVIDAHVSLQRAGMIRGQVFDPDGMPAAGVVLTAETAQRIRIGSATADDRGSFVLGSLPGGIVMIRIDPAFGRASWHRTWYYPGVHDRDNAQPITVNAGDSVDLELRAPQIPSATIRTRFTGPAGFRVEKMMVAQPETKMLINVQVAADGTASVTDLEEHRYAMAARGRAGAESLAAYQLIIVGSGDHDVPMTLELTAAVTGRIVVDRGGVPPVGDVSVEAHWVSGSLRLDPMGPDRVAVNPDGTFAMRDLFGRREFTVAGMPDEWRVTSIRAGRSDITSGIDLGPGTTTEIEIVVSRR